MSAQGKVGVVGATLMVTGNIMGSGIYLLPANLAATGGIALYGWIVTLMGAISISLVYAKWASFDDSPGGSYAYVKRAFGDFLGFKTSVVYWFQGWVGNVAMAVVGVGYLGYFFPVLRTPVPAAAASILAICFATSLNIMGPRMTTRLQSMTTSLVFVPVFGVAIFGWFYFDPALLSSSWNVQNQSIFNAIQGTLNVTLWSFIGVETAAVVAGSVKNPKRNVPIATIGGVLIAAVAYVLSTTAIMGIVPNEQLVISSAPFADAARVMVGPIGGAVVSFCAAAGCIGALSGWTFAIAQTGKAAADAGQFPKFYSRVNKHQAPYLGLMLTGVLQSIIIVLTISPTAAKQFGLVSSVAVILVLVPYIYSIAGLWRYSDQVFGKVPALWHAILAVALVYCSWSIIGSPPAEVMWCFVLVLFTSVLYAFHMRYLSNESSNLPPDRAG